MLIEEVSLDNIVEVVTDEDAVAVVLVPTTTLFVLEIVVLVDSVKIPLDSDNHLLHAAAEADVAVDILVSDVTELLLPLLLCLWYSSSTIILSRSDEACSFLLLCLLGGAFIMVLEAPAGTADVSADA